MNYNVYLMNSPNDKVLLKTFSNEQDAVNFIESSVNDIALSLVIE